MTALEERVEMLHNNSLQEMEMSIFSQRLLDKKKRSNLLSSPLPQRDNSLIQRDNSFILSKCSCEEILIVDDDAFNLLSLEII